MAAGFSVMNWVPSLGAMPMIVFGASTEILFAPAALVVGMYVTGRKVVGQDWFPGAATSWKFASCWGWSAVLRMVDFVSGMLVTILVACDGC